jgi:hypothetical protein
MPQANRELIVENCHRIVLLAEMMVEAGVRQFNAPLDDPDFETTDGEAYSLDLCSICDMLQTLVTASARVDPELAERLWECKFHGMLN